MPLLFRFRSFILKGANTKENHKTIEENEKNLGRTAYPFNEYVAKYTKRTGSDKITYAYVEFDGLST